MYSSISQTLNSVDCVSNPAWSCKLSYFVKCYCLREVLRPLSGNMFVRSQSAEEVDGQVFVKCFIISGIHTHTHTDFEYHRMINNVF